jgi:glycosyltransferase involved in cell wall biosynthesis
MASASLPEISVVLPVRNGQHLVARIVERLLESLGDLTARQCEVIVVDDGSDDATPEVAEELAKRYPQVRWIRHAQARGLELAGQTGLDVSRGELVFIQESPEFVRLQDLRRLYAMRNDDQLVVARTQTGPKPLAQPLLRRLRNWGARIAGVDQGTAAAVQAPAGLQMIRRRHAQWIAHGHAQQADLELSRISATAYEPIS